MNNITGSLKWSNGSINEKSKLDDKKTYMINAGEHIPAHRQAHEYKTPINEVDARFFNLPVNDLNLNNKKEENNLKFIEREQIANISLNPFLINSNYVNDIANRDKFLIPKDSNIINN